MGFDFLWVLGRGGDDGHIGPCNLSFQVLMDFSSVYAFATCKLIYTTSVSFEVQAFDSQ